MLSLYDLFFYYLPFVLVSTLSFQMVKDYIEVLYHHNQKNKKLN